MGTFPAVSLAQARREHENAEALVRRGIDPVTNLQYPTYIRYLISPSYSSCCKLTTIRHWRIVVTMQTVIELSPFTRNWSSVWTETEYT
ncbi:MAG: DUF4102 domain-containing protein, partial [Granulosicoccus sp.]|nr:DUF4102 domain-containing protein [Granulosicoccus sp.]